MDIDSIPFNRFIGIARSEQEGSARSLPADVRYTNHLGTVHANVSVTPETKKEFVSNLTSKGRALIEMPVDVYDEKGTHTLAAVVEWFVARRP